MDAAAAIVRQFGINARIRCRRSSCGKDGLPWRPGGAALSGGARPNRATLSVSATAFIGNRPAAARARAAAIFFGLDLLEGFLEVLDLGRLLAEQAVELADLLPQRPALGGRDQFLARSGGRVGTLGRQPVPGEKLVGFTPCRRATRLTEAPGA
jgi:hypothetical protein